MSIGKRVKLAATAWLLALYSAAVVIQLSQVFHDPTVVQILLGVPFAFLSAVVLLPGVAFFGGLLTGLPFVAATAFALYFQSFVLEHGYRLAIAAFVVLALVEPLVSAMVRDNPWANSTPFAERYVTLLFGGQNLIYAIPSAVGVAFYVFALRRRLNWSNAMKD